MVYKFRGHRGKEVIQMVNGIDINEVKKYNETLRQYKEKSAKIRAELEFNEKELNRQCEELSRELGVSVTPENIGGLLAEKIEKINNTMQVGTDILNRIRAEENNASAQQNMGGTVGQSVTVGQAAGQPVAPVAPVAQPVAPVQQAAVPNAQQVVIPSVPVFNGLSDDLPPIFNDVNPNLINI